MTSTVYKCCICTYHYIWTWFGHGRKYIDTFGWEVSFTSCSIILSITPSTVHDCITIILLQDDEIASLEAQEGWPFTCGGEIIYTSWISSKQRWWQTFCVINMITLSHTQNHHKLHYTLLQCPIIPCYCRTACFLPLQKPCCYPRVPMQLLQGESTANLYKQCNLFCIVYCYESRESWRESTFLNLFLPKDNIKCVMIAANKTCNFVGTFHAYMLQLSFILLFNNQTLFI